MLNLDNMSQDDPLKFLEEISNEFSADEVLDIFTRNSFNSRVLKEFRECLLRYIDKVYKNNIDKGFRAYNLSIYIENINLDQPIELIVNDVRDLLYTGYLEKEDQITLLLELNKIIEELKREA